MVHGHMENCVNEPTMIDALKEFQIKQIDFLSNTTICVGLDNHLYIWGKGYVFGFKDTDFSSPIGITQCGRIKQVACAYSHALFIGEQGSVYSIGKNTSGNLGLGHRKESPGFNKIDLFDLMEVAKVQAGDFSAVLIKSGEVYVFGGIGEESYLSPHLMEGIRDVVDISLTHGHILALTKSNELFSWGNNESGCCGVGDLDRCSTCNRSSGKSIMTPMRVHGLQDCQILQLSTGSDCSLIKYKTKRDLD